MLILWCTMILKISSPHHISPTSHHHRCLCIIYPFPVVGANSLMYDDPQDFIRENNLIVEDMGRHVQCVLNFMDNQVHPYYFTHRIPTILNDSSFIHPQHTLDHNVILSYCPHLTCIPSCLDYMEGGGWRNHCGAALSQIRQGMGRW